MSTDKPSPPVAARRPVERTLWGRTDVDHYQWLQERDSAEVLDHLEAENAYTEEVLAPVAGLREELFVEIKSRILETDMSVPVTDGPWSYYSRTTEGLAYPIHCRRPADAPPAPDKTGEAASDVIPVDDPHEQVLLDENAEAEGHQFFDIGVFDVSPDHRYLLWGVDRTGDERFAAVVRDLETGQDLDDGLDELSYGSAWSTDNRTLFYVRPDDAERPHEVWRHEVGTPVGNDVLVYREDDERFFVGVGREKDDSFIQIASGSKVTTEVRIIPADRPTDSPQVVAERRQGVEYSVFHHDERFVILTNDGAENFRVMTVPDDDPGPDGWVELIAGRDDVTVSGLDVSARYLTLFERTGGTTGIRLMEWSTGAFIDVAQPEEVSTSWPGANPDFEATTLRYGYSSMVTPPSVFLLDIESGDRTLLKQQPVLGDFDPDRYRTKRLWATATDGVEVPISVVWRADREGPGPCLLYAYGAYEASMDPVFSSARLSLLDRGFCFAIAHARGGGEMGRRWYEDGKFERKQHTFDDVIAAARLLIDDGWTSPDGLVLRGGSAGGLMAGAVVNQAPELFRAVVAQVAFVDCLNTILDPSLPLTVTEWEEWGNPATDEHIFDAMRAYTPYENVAAQDYPSIMATGGLHDSRVSYWEPAKWVQELRHTATSDTPILLWTELAAGHGGPTGRYDAWREEARILSYVLWITGNAETAAIS